MEINNCCDIIIPVYNACHELRECVDSIFKYTNDSKYRIIIINDKSPMNDVEEYLKELENKNIENIIILRNDENLGFVKTVNRGMHFSKNDVILLNSDTVVTQGWLLKLFNCAYSQENIATVTPLTNNGTICSVPNFCQDNELPEGFTVDSFARFIEIISMKIYPVIPTAVGFCMYIKRKVLDEVGFFDEEAFGKGYGEENDFCCRVTEYGHINVIADDTYVYHKGSMSFKENKRQLIESHFKILEKRYPYYFKNVQKFIESNPLKLIHESISESMDNYKGQAKNVLYILHNDFEKPLNHPIGGTEFHVKDLAENIENVNSFVLIASDYKLILKRIKNGAWDEYIFLLNNLIDINTFSCNEYRKILDSIILTFNINIIHIHHFKKHTFDSVYLAEKYGIPLLITIHDYYLICPKVNLLDEDNNYCIDMRDDEKCRKCIKSTFGFDTHFLKKWKEEVSKLLPKFSQIIVPSESVKEILGKEFNLSKITVIEHGIKLDPIENGNINTEKLDENFNIGFIGGLAPNKGSEIIYNLITKNKDSKIRWYLIGGIGDLRLNLLERKDVIKLGRYDRNELVNLLKSNSIDLICILSIWPETYSYTLSEAWAADIPVLGSNLGAVKDRIEATGAGIIVENLSPDTILDTIYKYKASKQMQQQIKYALKNVFIKTVAQMEKEYEMIYISGVENAKYKRLDDNKFISCANLSKYKLQNNNYGDSNLEKFLQVEQELKRIQSSLAWKLLIYIRTKYPWAIKLCKKVILLLIRFKRKIRK